MPRKQRKVKTETTSLPQTNIRERSPNAYASVSSILKLPQELYREIVSSPNLRRRDWQRLALAHPNFTTLCQEQIFSCIEFERFHFRQDPIYNGTVSRFKRLLDQSPLLGVYVKILIINDFREYDQDYLWEPADGDRLIAILHLLPNLQAFGLNPSVEAPSRWRTDCAVKLLATILHLPTLTHAHISYLPISFINLAGPNLQHLCITASRDIQPIEFQCSEWRSVVSLTSLHFHDYCELTTSVGSLQSPETALKVDKLKKLVVNGITRNIATHTHISTLLGLCSSSLEELIFVPRYHGFDEPAETLLSFEEPIDLSLLTSLRKVRFEISAGDYDPKKDGVHRLCRPAEWRQVEGWMDDLSRFNFLINRPKNPCSALEHMILVCRICDGLFDDDDEMEDLWLAIVETLMGDKYPQLSRLEIGIYAEFEHKARRRTFLTRFQRTSYVEMLQANSKFVVDIVECEDCMFPFQPYYADEVTLLGRILVDQSPWYLRSPGHTWSGNIVPEGPQDFQTESAMTFPLRRLFVISYQCLSFPHFKL